MAENSLIEWTDATWNPVAGCSLVSAGCTNCYAMKQAQRVKRMEEARTGVPNHYFGTTKVVNGKAVWTGKIGIAPDHILTAPLRWKKPRRIFVNSMSDLFHELVPDEVIDRVFAVMALAPQHTYQILTKRPDRMRSYMKELSQEPGDRLSHAARTMTSEEGQCAVANWINGWSRWKHMPDDGNPLDGSRPRWPLPNVWLGVSVEDQTRADERIPLLLDTPAAVRWVSAEPLLGPVDLLDIAWPSGRLRFPETDDISDARSSLHLIDDVRLDWIVTGGESGPGARCFEIEWARAIVEQCRAARVAVFVKQLGSNPTFDSQPFSPSLRDRAGGDPAEWPKDLRVREFPRMAA